MPGVSIRTAVRSGPAAQSSPPSARYFVVGTFARGPIEPTRVRSFVELVNLYGDRPAAPAAWDDLRVYFEEGGGEAVVRRVVGAAATKGTITVKDTAGKDTLRVDAASPGAYSSGVSLVISAGAMPDTVAAEVRLNGVAVERRDNLTSPAAVAGAFATSNLVRVVDMGSTTAAPGNLPAAGTVTLTAGTDDYAAITAKTYTDALPSLAGEWGAGCVSIPGQPALTVGPALIDHAKTYNRLALLAPPKGSTPNDAEAAADALITANGGEFAGLFYPWVKVPGLVAGSTLTVSPEGFVAAARARAHTAEGPWRVPAGEMSTARYVVDVETKLDRVTGDRLDDAAVNAIRPISGAIRLYGWRSLSPDVPNYGMLHGRDLVNSVVYAAGDLLERHVFRPIDAKGHLLADVAADLIGLAEPIKAAGGLYPRIVDGEEADPGYSVDVSEALNPLDQLARNRIAAVLALRVSPVGALIEVTVVKAALTANV